MFNFDDWFSLFWEKYPKDLCNYRKGSKAQAKAAAKIKVKNEKKAKEVMDATDAWARYSRHEMKKTGFTPCWPHVVRWFRHERYDEPIPSYADMPEEKINHVEKLCHCGNPVHGPGFAVCTQHMEKVVTKLPRASKSVSGEDALKKAKQLLTR